MKSKLNKADMIAYILMTNWLWVVIFLAIIVGMVKACVGDDIDPMDNSINTSREVVEHVIVTDSTYNGFRVVYATKNSVTPERFAEIKSRAHIQASFEKLKREAPRHFGGLLETDIYDFAIFAKEYDVDQDIKIHNIFVEGRAKKNLYIGPNPMIEKPALYIDENTDQGVQYLKCDDIYYMGDTTNRIYRYWKCQGIHAMSFTDERYSHFSEDNRIR